MAGLTSSDLRDLLSFTTALARKAGAVILEGSRAIQSASASDIGEKKNSVDLVTEYDVKVEELVKREIKDAYPEFQFIGEESYSAGSRAPLTDAPTFCVDPIDGTTNFVHAFPFACISIGLIDQRRPVLGVIYNPFLDHLYTGVSGQGSFLSRSGGPPERLPLGGPARPLPALSQALVAIEWGSDRKAPAITQKADSFTRLAGDPAGGVAGGRMAHSLRSLGSAALNFAMVAQGGLDMYWEIGCWPWDVCAGIVIAQEAGGFVTGSKDAPHDGNVTEAILTGRKYLVVRGIAGSEGETSLAAQQRIAREFYDTVEDVPLDG
ncbi:inositol monophosphatase [Auriscalpium vulgare]|uniref:Inositol monophosphatase n=1 Tax=Auriscalpium vulgare TaxID=40419 RepID=A0ACB8RA49_9AGAM|nr:inositol monophosphatase [Auriscalpium vulgare]